MALKGVKVIEMMGLAPGPLCGTILADFGASVTVIQKIDSIANMMDVMTNGKKILKINLKTKEGVQVLTKMCSSSDVLIDTYRPGVMEKLGLGPESVSRINPKLIFARLSGYGQKGYYKHKGGHDINYVAMSGLLSLFKKNNEPPFIPVNLVADFAGGSLMCALGILMALLERSNSGKGQVVDCSMTEGAAYLGTWVYKSRKLPIWQGEPGTNLLDGGAPFYATYRTKDNKFMAVGAIEPHFYSNLLQGLNLTEDDLPDGNNERKEKFQEVFLRKTQEEWSNIFEKLDACVTPVLEMDAVDTHECNKSRESFYKDSDNFIVPEPAPKLSATPGHSSGKRAQPKGDEDAIEILQELGYKNNEIDDLIKKGIVKADKKAKL
ncbi:alpha-methylacyl-CoA racemase [Papilio machaon]|uniref:alpha-methylacyl-CoA racemase n=1 Tax=Papilio machaon TaxID=76193 RepID=UPI001E66456A|nr:alpha-methylacyl-CoA racemase [Papilio machaon]